MRVAAAVCSLVLGVGFGIPDVCGALHVACTGEVWKFLGFPTYGNGPFEHWGVPTWIGLCERDISVSNKAIERFAARTSHATLQRYREHDHFSPFSGDATTSVAADQVAFLRTIGLAPGVG